MRHCAESRISVSSVNKIWANHTAVGAMSFITQDTSLIARIVKVAGKKATTIIVKGGNGISLGKQ